MDAQPEPTSPTPDVILSEQIKKGFGANADAIEADIMGNMDFVQKFKEAQKSTVEQVLGGKFTAPDATSTRDVMDELAKIEGNPSDKFDWDKWLGWTGKGSDAPTNNEPNPEGNKASWAKQMGEVANIWAKIHKGD